ncbi:Quinone oxidoreductase 1 [Roseimaritima multifibrata]|uniref:Quinone oxidoreductase 1 n=1 Tax=Roseimaritima multifibrata TaxID=1930274 RepID=A0A517MCV8_9BACT|nr:NAD(P)H-quinone oxidoreductase [Roseimaritima multifibrata]QDS92733.1 Quinone oxidoreductase 1 [Roseimaritima multifibrata]
MEPENSMQAMEITKAGGPEVFKLCQRPIPKPAPGEVLIKIAYAGVNRPDALQRAGKYRPPPDASDLPGLEAAGEIVGLGTGCQRWKLGDWVCALLPGGGYAQYAVTSESHCLPVPTNMDLKSAACLPETYFTVWSNVVMRGGLKPGERFLLHGGSSGIGTTAIQIAKALGAEVFTTSGTAEKCQACRELGADRAMDYKREDFVAIVKAAGGADLILDMVGGDYVPRNIDALAEEGRLVQIGFMKGAKGEIDLMRVMSKRLTITGSTLRPQSKAMKARIADELLTKVWPLLDAAKIAPVIDSEFPLTEAAVAHQRMESGEHIGKIVLRI